MRKLDQNEVAKSGAEMDYTLWGIETIPAMQVAVYTMCEGGFLGRFAAEQPGHFYIDDRVKTRFPKRVIYQAVETLATIAKANGLDPNNLPQMPRFHNLGCL